jgi:hypothetical protein
VAVQWTCGPSRRMVEGSSMERHRADPFRETSAYEVLRLLAGPKCTELNKRFRDRGHFSECRMIDQEASFSFSVLDERRDSEAALRFSARFSGSDPEGIWLDYNVEWGTSSVKRSCYFERKLVREVRQKCQAFLYGSDAAFEIYDTDCSFTLILTPLPLPSTIGCKMEINAFHQTKGPLLQLRIDHAVADREECQNFLDRFGSLAEAEFI